MELHPIGIDLGKTVFHLVGMNLHAEAVVRKKLSRRQLLQFGVSESSVSRQAIEASEAELEALLSRRFDDLKLLIIYIDGVVFGEHTMIGAVGVDAEGRKHVLGIREGPRRTPPWLLSYCRTSWLGALIRSRNACSSSMVRRLSGPQSTQSSAPISPSSAAVRTSCATCSITFPKSRRSR